MTPTTVGLVLVEGDGRDGATMNHDAFEVRRGGFSPVTTSEYVAEALSRTRAITGGQRLFARRGSRMQHGGEAWVGADAHHAPDPGRPGNRQGGHPGLPR